MRGILPEIRHVQKGDPVQRGVAVRTTAKSVLVHPYVYRQVCRNGAIAARTIQTCGVELVDPDEPPDVVDNILWQLREAVTACCEPDLFLKTVRQWRSARDRYVDHAITLLPFVRGRRSTLERSLVDLIFREFEREGDHSVYGLMNAVTATARRTADPEKKWNLEELGGGIPALVQPKLTPGGAHTELVAV
jgi:hypothetical protein